MREKGRRLELGVFLSLGLLLGTFHMSAHSQAGPPPGSGAESGPGQVLAREVRAAILRDAALSPEARGVRVVGRGGRVALYGVARGAEERDRLTAAAARYAGAAAVDDRLVVVSEPDSGRSR